MVYYYEPVSTVMQDNTEHEIVSITSTKEESKRIDLLQIMKSTNEGILRVYLERDNIATIPTVTPDGSDNGKRELDVKLDVGETLSITLQNKTAGSNAGVTGFVKYLIE